MRAAARKKLQELTTVPTLHHAVACITRDSGKHALTNTDRRAKNPTKLSLQTTLSKLNIYIDPVLFCLQDLIVDKGEL